MLVILKAKPLAKMQPRLFLWMYPSQIFVLKHNQDKRDTFKILSFRVKLIFNGNATGTFTIASKSVFLKH